MVEIELEFDNNQKIKFEANPKNTLEQAMNESKIEFNMNKNLVIFVSNFKKIYPEDIIESIMTEEEKQTKKIKILIIALKDNFNPKEIICPECVEPCRILIKDYKISLFHSYDSHQKDDLKLEEFKKMQNDLLTKLNCINCKKNSEFKCLECKQYLCQNCKESHNKNHKIFNNKEIKLLCQKHDKLFIKYCRECDSNLCDLCEKEHSEHYISDFKSLFPNYNEINEKLGKLREKIDIFNNNIKEIIKKLEKVTENMEILYNITENIVKSYNSRYTNFDTLLNVIDVNKFIEKELENIEDYDYGNNINKILYLYNEMCDKNSEAELHYEFEPTLTNEDYLKLFGDNFINKAD